MLDERLKRALARLNLSSEEIALAIAHYDRLDAHRRENHHIYNTCELVAILFAELCRLERATINNT